MERRKNIFLFPTIEIILEQIHTQIMTNDSDTITTSVFLRIIHFIRDGYPNLEIKKEIKTNLVNLLMDELKSSVSPRIEDEIILRSNVVLTLLKINKTENDHITLYLEFVENYVKDKSNISSKFYYIIFIVLLSLNEKVMWSGDVKALFETIKANIRSLNPKEEILFQLIEDLIFNKTSNMDVQIEPRFNYGIEELWLVSKILVRQQEYTSLNHELFGKIFMDVFEQFKGRLEDKLLYNRSEINYLDLLLLEIFIDLEISFSLHRFGQASVFSLAEISDNEKILQRLNYTAATVYEQLIVAKNLIKSKIKFYRRAIIFILHNALETTCKYILIKDQNMNRSDLDRMNFEIILDKVKEKRRYISRKGESLQKLGFNHDFFSNLDEFRRNRNNLQHEGSGLVPSENLVINSYRNVMRFCSVIFDLSINYDTLV